MTGLRIHDDAVGELAIGDDGLSVGAVEIHRMNAAAAQLENEQAADTAQCSLFWSPEVQSDSIDIQRYSDDDPSGSCRCFRPGLCVFASTVSAAAIHSSSRSVAQKRSADSLSFAGAALGLSVSR